jgi:homoserine dehydrogenase
MDVVLVGFGTVGQGVAETLARKAPILQAVFKEKVRMVGVFDSKSSDSSPRGLDPREILARKEKLGKVGAKLDGQTVAELLDSIEYDVMIETTPTNIIDAQPGFAHMMHALSSGHDVVTANKGPLALKFKELSSTAERNGARIRFEASVGGATPVINMSRELLLAEKIYSIRGIVNGTCNFILNRMKDEGLPFDQALREAQEMGYAEKDPSYDIDGIDSAAKAAILANAIFHRDVTFNEVRRTGIRGVSLEAVELASEEKKVVRDPQHLPADHGPGWGDHRGGPRGRKAGDSLRHPERSGCLDEGELPCQAAGNLNIKLRLCYAISRQARP